MQPTLAHSILLIENRESGLRSRLEATGARVERCSGPQAALAASFRPRLTVLDSTLVGRGARSWVRRLVEAGFAPLLVGCRAGEGAAVARALADGAVDFLAPDEPRLLAGVLERALAAPAGASEVARTPSEGDPVDDFVREAVHEFCTPLTVVREFVANLEEGLAGPLNDKQEEYLGYIRDSSEEMHDMFEAFRDVVRYRLLGLACRAQECSVRDLFDSMHEDLGPRFASRKLELAQSVDADARWIHADPRHLRQILASLLRHASKMSPRGGRVELRAEPAGHGRVLLSVSDEGPAPTPADIEVLRRGVHGDRIGERSVTHLFGIGMELARALVQLNLGEIALRVSASGGSSREALLPSAAAVEARAALPL